MKIVDPTKSAAYRAAQRMAEEAQRAEAEERAARSERQPAAKATIDASTQKAAEA